MMQELENPRAMRGLQIAQKGGIEQIELNKYRVPTQWGSGSYIVNFGEHEPTCNCPDCQTRGVKCKHQWAVEHYLKFEKDNLGNMTVTEVKKVSYKQDWKAYNKAQTSEINTFDTFLKDLVQSVEEPERDPSITGRKPISLADGIFCSVQKVYSQLSSRRAHSLYKNAERNDQLIKVPHFNAINKFLNREDITPILHDLLSLSALPLKAVETDFAIDSSGFRTTKFDDYCREKHKIKKQHRWIKAHIMCGTKTNVISSARITKEYGADCPQFEPLVRITNENGFDVKEVSGDKAYLSRDNLALVDELGGTAYIPFKKGNRGTRTRGSSPIWKKMYHMFAFKNEEFMRHYHKRSNVETVFQMIKAKFGDKVKSKNWIAQQNELLCKLIAHNICVLIQEMYELGINPNFA
jgi:transposase